MPQEKPATSIAIAVVERDDRFLIAPRPAGVALAGLWEFPGGKVEPGESAAQAAVRECLEETGLAVRILAHFLDHTQQYAHGRVQLAFFTCAPLDDASEPRPPFRWVPRAELAKLEFPEGNRGLLARLLGRLP